MLRVETCPSCQPPPTTRPPDRVDVASLHGAVPRAVNGTHESTEQGLSGTHVTNDRSRPLRITVIACRLGTHKRADDR